MKDDCQLSFITTNAAKALYKEAAKLSGLSLAAWMRVQLNIQALRTVQKAAPTIPRKQLKLLCAGMVKNEILRTTKGIRRPTSTRRSRAR